MSSPFALSASLERAEQRLRRPKGRKPRSDRGGSRLAPALQRRLTQLLRAQDRPRMADVLRDLARVGSKRQPPSRATLYNAIARCRPLMYRVPDLPSHVRVALYNVAPMTDVDGALVAFYAFNHGDLRAACWAAGLPWLALHHAARMRGWRPKSRGLLLAVMQRRGIT